MEFLKDHWRKLMFKISFTKYGHPVALYASNDRAFRVIRGHLIDPLSVDYVIATPEFEEFLDSRVYRYTKGEWHSMEEFSAVNFYFLHAQDAIEAKLCFGS